MSTDQTLQAARQRGQEQALPYAGAVTPKEAFALLQNDSKILIVDVRTNAERDWVGRVNISEAQHLAVQWSLYPGGTPNPDFLAQLQASVPDKASTILFLCRSGVRSRHGAKLATENGYTNCYDILQGFEGDKDEQGHRKTVGGWCQNNLPWLGA
ncbi:rhodanese-like domain-containing protein [Undibacterium sp. Tian12W]|uniref:rhodanese-like domain-containing protein n=1 Tax=Undibacterium sp. Tian12W TaxID=3413054 RepID=UPI003BF07DCF